MTQQAPDKINVFWFLPTHGDGRYLGTTEGGRPVDLPYLQQVALAADSLGYYGVLIPTGKSCEDSWLVASALAPLTRRLRYLVAVRPGLQPPTLAARMAATLDRLSEGRLLINVVTGGDPVENKGDGIFLSHSERYQVTREFLDVYTRLLRGEKVDYHGEHIHVEGAEVLFPPVQENGPPLYFGGSSDAAIDVAAEQIDSYLTWGEPPELVAEKLAVVRERAAARGRTLQYGIRLHVIVRETEEEAWAAADRLIAHLDDDTIAQAQKIFARMDSAGQARMSALHQGSRDNLRIAPNLWAGVGLFAACAPATGRAMEIAMSSQREIRLNAFDMNCIGHQSPGLWAHPRDRSWQYKDLEYWVDLARLLERGKFDGLFIADVLGIYDVLNGSGDAAIRQATQVPVNDPLALITPMALVTEHLGFGLTASLSFEHPYPFARRLSTLDHLTKGRVGWNIVTSYLESGARNIGQQTQTDHDTRYDYADEYLQVIYKLLEGSWEDGAVLRDRERKIFSDPRKIHPINHQGQFFSVPGIHLCEPSPQRTPVLYQAGASSRGKQFAAGHAECVFVAAPSKVLLKKTVADIRRRAAEAGRDPHSILIFNLQTVIVGDTDREAQAKWQEYKQYVSYEGALALLSGWTGIDFGQYQPDQVLKYLHTNAIQSAVEAFSTADPNRQWTVQALADWAGIGGFGPLVVGSAQTVADELQSWVEETDVDGFNLAYAVTHETFRDVVELLVPELQKRGVFKQEYREGTLREKLFGGGPRLAAPHPGASYRRDARTAASVEEKVT